MNSIYISIFIVSLLLSTISVPKFKKIGGKYNLFDKQDNRKKKNNKIVRLGGAGIYFSLMISIIIISLFFKVNVFDNNLIDLIIIGCSAFFLIGFADDLLNISPWPRLFLQFLITSILWLKGLRIQEINLSFLSSGEFFINLNNGISLFLTTFWIVGVTNSINWIDGVDGLAGGFSLIASLALFFCGILNDKIYESIILISVAGCCLGFLKSNLFPAKIYMGDGGSYLLGFLLASISICISSTGDYLNPLMPLSVFIYPLLDMTNVIFGRIYRKNSPFFPDRSHLHYKLIDKDFSEKNLIYIIFGYIQFIMIITMYLNYEIENKLFLIISFILLIFTFLKSNRNLINN